MGPEVKGYNLDVPESTFGPAFSLALILAITDINNWMIVYLAHIFLPYISLCI